MTTWTPLHKGSGGEFVLDGISYRIDRLETGADAVLSVVDGPSVAVAEGLGRTPWAVRTHDRFYTFDRTIDRWTEQQLVVRGRSVGAVRQAGRSGRHAAAELPDVPDPVAVFVMALVLDMWREHERRAR
ncbi:hypothetical protein [Pseudonocardia lacus]|uniref:hypothetical protein n=1 Tax=Pseudonocardia lacus TaxID=2835865 RepID=UPI001BDC027B|nr:hypothetical protein [Pseudonocardia lacus]